MTQPALRLERLGLALPRSGRLVPVLEDISLTIAPGECAALLGESGSGKTLTALSIPRLLPEGAIATGRIFLGPDEISAWPESRLRTARGRRVGMVFQDPRASLNPLHRVGAQIAEPLRLHARLSRRAAWARAVELLADMGIERPAERASAYPHEFSGGMLQRAAIAAAIACGPSLLIADEPVSSLDSANAAQIMALLDRLRGGGLAILLVCHDLRLVRQHATSATVLYAGSIAEQGPAEAVLRAPLHRYTLALARAAPRLGFAPIGLDGQVPEPEQRGPACRFARRCEGAQPACTAALPKLPPAPHSAACLFPALPGLDTSAPAVLPPPSVEPLLILRDVTVQYRASGAWPWRGTAAPAVFPTSLTLHEGECLALIGPSGSGKTSLARAILGMLPHGGSVTLRGTHLAGVRGAARRRIGLVFQNPAASLNPTMSVAALIAEPMRLAGAPAASRTVSLLQDVGLSPALLPRRAATLSGGQAQRVAIARALAADPALLILDEPTASLDTVTQALILTLLRDLAAARGLAYIVITHDLAAVSFMAHRVAVMRGGRIIEA